MASETGKRSIVTGVLKPQQVPHFRTAFSLFGQAKYFPEFDILCFFLFLADMVSKVRGTITRLICNFS